MAVLIDAENASPRIAAGLFEHVAAIGEAGVRRLYGDFSGTRLKGWADVLSAHALVPHHNPAVAVGKNASDIALVIDAMDLLHARRIDAFCLVTSDGDFTRLAARIREQGLDVYGFGERKAPESFRRACKRFVYTEEFAPAPVSQSSSVGPDTTDGSSTEPPKHLPPDAAVARISAALEHLEHRDGWYSLGVVGKQLASEAPRFDLKRYACAKLVTLIGKTEAFDVRRDGLRVYIRPKRTAAIQPPPRPATRATSAAHPNGAIIN